MIVVSEIIEKIKSENNAALENLRVRNVKLDLSNEDFKDLFLLLARKNMIARGIDKEFIVDDSNKEIINQLFYYLTKSEYFKGNFNKGILLMGSIGIGKTLIMLTICDIIQYCGSLIFTKTNAKRIPDLLREKEAGYYDRRPMFIDDLGREPKEINNYGTKELPIIDLISIRYDYGTLTFATTNFNEEKLKEFYGEQIADRFKEIFNIMILKGNSKRN